MDYWARLLAACALLASTISMFVSWRAYRRDRSDLRVNLDYRPETGAGTSFHVRVVNFGRRPAMVELVHVNFPSSKPLLESFAGGQEVDEGQPLDVWLPIYSRSEEADVPIKVTGADVYDTLGNKYSYPGISLRKRIEFARMKTAINKHWIDYLDRESKKS